MCRYIKFEGSCSHYGEKQIWEDLSQRLSYLKAKNNEHFGNYAHSIFVEPHAFDQECQRCIDEDEGFGDLGVHGVRSVNDKRKPADEIASSSAKKQRA